MREPIIFDCEAAPVDGAEAYLEPVSAPSNYVKQEAIDRYVEKATADQLKRCGLDPDLARIVAIGVSRGEEVEVQELRTQAQERDALAWFWSLVAPHPYPTLIGFNVIGYDLPLMLRRSLYLGVKTPSIAIGKYRHPDVTDLMLMLSFDGALKYRSLDFYCRRFGLDVPGDDVDGSDIAQLVEADKWDDIRLHCQRDVERVLALARRIGVLSGQAIPA